MSIILSSASVVWVISLFVSLAYFEIKGNHIEPRYKKQSILASYLEDRIRSASIVQSLCISTIVVIIFTALVVF